MKTKLLQNFVIVDHSLRSLPLQGLVLTLQDSGNEFGMFVFLASWELHNIK